MATETPAILGGTAIKPVERHGFEAVKYFFWDKDRGTIMGRTPKSWALILGFYVIYYTFLAAFWALMWAIFYTTLDDASPKFTVKQSLIGESPGLGVIPNTKIGDNETFHLDSKMIIFSKNRPRYEKDVYNYPGWQDWEGIIDEIFNEKYNDHEHNLVCKGLHQNNEQLGNDYNKVKKACRFDLSTLDSCSPIPRRGQKNYGYKVGEPCVFLKLNKIFGLEHAPYTKDELADAFNEEPKDLRFPKQRLEEMKRFGFPDDEKVWITCAGEKPFDRENIERIDYYPKDGGLSTTFFPYKVPPEVYQSPLVAVKFFGLKPGVLIHVECRAWAKNIKYDHQNKIGSVQFELLVLDETTEKAFLQKKEEDEKKEEQETTTTSTPTSGGNS